MNRIEQFKNHLLAAQEAEEKIQKIEKALRAQATSSSANNTTTSSSLNNKQYRFTADEDGILTKEQRDQYEKDGFIVVRGLVPVDVIDGLVDRFRHLIKHPEERPPMMTVVRDVSLAKAGVTKEEANTEEMITKFQDFVDDDGLFSYCRLPQIHRIVQAIVGKENGLQAMHTMLINKPPQKPGLSTSIHPLHQDLWYFSFGPADKICAAWCAMEEVTLENGCLTVVPGTHTTPLLKHGYPEFDVNKAYHQIMEVDIKNAKQIPVPMSKGDVVFFHPLLWHGSGPNNSKRTRKAICCHFASTACKYFDVKGTIQQEIEDEVKEMLKIKMTRRGMEVPDVDLSDLWNIRSKVVIGENPMQKA